MTYAQDEIEEIRKLDELYATAMTEQTDEAWQAYFVANAEFAERGKRDE